MSMLPEDSLDEIQLTLKRIAEALERIDNSLASLDNNGIVTFPETEE